MPRNVISEGSGPRNASSARSLQENLDSTAENAVMPFEVEVASFPPPDTGRQAWLILAGCSVIQAPVWRMPTIR
jgi:hypothetical protein